MFIALCTYRANYIRLGMISLKRGTAEALYVRKAVDRQAERDWGEIRSWHPVGQNKVYRDRYDGVEMALRIKQQHPQASFTSSP